MRHMTKGGWLAAGWLLLALAPMRTAYGQLGFFNVQLDPGLQLVGDPLVSAQNNRLAVVFPGVPQGTEVYEFGAGDFSTNILTTNALSQLVWQDPLETLLPGVGAFVLNPTNKVLTVSIFGNAASTSVTNPVPAGLSSTASYTAVWGGLTSKLGLSLSPFDNVYRWEKGRFVVYTQLPGGGWYPTEPNIGLGEGFFINASQPTNWVEPAR